MSSSTLLSTSSTSGVRRLYSNRSGSGSVLMREDDPAKELSELRSRREQQSESATSTASSFVLSNDAADHYNQCVTLVRDNKVCKKNAFNLSVVDYLRYEVAKSRDLSKSGVGLSTAARIYGVKVDVIQDECRNVLAALGGGAAMKQFLEAKDKAGPDADPLQEFEFEVDEAAAAEADADEKRVRLERAKKILRNRARKKVYGDNDALTIDPKLRSRAVDWGLPVEPDPEYSCLTNLKTNSMGQLVLDRSVNYCQFTNSETKDPGCTGQLAAAGQTDGHFLEKLKQQIHQRQQDDFETGSLPAFWEEKLENFWLDDGQFDSNVYMAGLEGFLFNDADGLLAHGRHDSDGVGSGRSLMDSDDDEDNANRYEPDMNADEYNYVAGLTDDNDNDDNEDVGNISSETEPAGQPNVEDPLSRLVPTDGDDPAGVAGWAGSELAARRNTEPVTFSALVNPKNQLDLNRVLEFVGREGGTVQHLKNCIEKKWLSVPEWKLKPAENCLSVGPGIADDPDKTADTSKKPADQDGSVGLFRRPTKAMLRRENPLRFDFSSIDDKIRLAQDSADNDNDDLLEEMFLSERSGKTSRWIRYFSSKQIRDRLSRVSSAGGAGTNTYGARYGLVGGVGGVGLAGLAGGGGGDETAISIQSVISSIHNVELPVGEVGDNSMPVNPDYEATDLFRLSFATNYTLDRLLAAKDSVADGMAENFDLGPADGRSAGQQQQQPSAGGANLDFSDDDPYGFELPDDNTILPDSDEEGENKTKTEGHVNNVEEAVNTTLIDGPEQLSQEDLGYTKVAKRISMKRLKASLQHYIDKLVPEPNKEKIVEGPPLCLFGRKTDKQPTYSNENDGTQFLAEMLGKVPRKLISSERPVLTPALAFSALLQLAHEDGLELTNVGSDDDGSLDVLIRKSSEPIKEELRCQWARHHQPKRRRQTLLTEYTSDAADVLAGSGLDVPSGVYQSTPIHRTPSSRRSRGAKLGLDAVDDETGPTGTGFIRSFSGKRVFAPVKDVVDPLEREVCDELEMSRIRMEQMAGDGATGDGDAGDGGAGDGGAGDAGRDGRMEAQLD